MSALGRCTTWGIVTPVTESSWEWCFFKRHQAGNDIVSYLLPEQGLFWEAHSELTLYQRGIWSLGGRLAKEIAGIQDPWGSELWTGSQAWRARSPSSPPSTSPPFTNQAPMTGSWILDCFPIYKMRLWNQIMSYAEYWPQISHAIAQWALIYN